LWLHFAEKSLLMKKSILLLGCFAFAIGLHAQIYAEGKLLDEIYQGKYLAIQERGIFGTNEIGVIIDHGQRTVPLEWDEVTDETGKMRRFNSIVDILNFFEENGWSYLNAHTVNSENEHYLLLKRK
jgi:hypothetical protein